MHDRCTSEISIDEALHLSLQPGRLLLANGADILLVAAIAIGLAAPLALKRAIPERMPGIGG